VHNLLQFLVDWIAENVAGLGVNVLGLTPVPTSLLPISRVRDIGSSVSKSVENITETVPTRTAPKCLFVITAPADRSTAAFSSPSHVFRRSAHSALDSVSGGQATGLPLGALQVACLQQKVGPLLPRKMSTRGVVKLPIQLHAALKHLDHPPDRLRRVNDALSTIHVRPDVAWVQDRRDDASRREVD
jgi:hypothetical protein